MVSMKYFFISVHCWLCPNYSSMLSLSPDGRFAATCGKFTNFKVQELKSGAVHSMQCQVPSHPAYCVGNSKITAMQVTPPDTQHMCTENQSVCFSHEGFAVASSANENKVYVWDTECGDKLLTLDHGGKFVNLRRMIVLISGTEGSKVHTLVVRQVRFYQRSW